MTASIRILTTASLDSNPSLLIVSPNGSKTLINCGEGCQRSFLESASASSASAGTLRVSSVSRVCLTHIGHDTLGGLPGMILTTADVVDSVAKDMKATRRKNLGLSGVGDGVGAGNSNGSNQNDNTRQTGNTNGNANTSNNKGQKRQRNASLLSNNDEEGMPDLEIVGPTGTSTFLHSLRHFMRRDRFKVHAHEGEYDSSLNKNKASMSYNAKKKAKKKKFKGSADIDETSFNVKSIPISYDATPPSSPQNHDENDQSTQPPPQNKQAVSYLFTTPPIPGKFLIEKAQALNVPRGPMYGQLKNGKNVTFTDSITGEERTVMSEEVVAKSSPGVGVVVVYCPNLEVFSGLKKDRALCALVENNASKDKGNATTLEEISSLELSVMVHLTPKSIFHNPAYKSWCREFGKDVDHITLHVLESLEERSLDEENSPFVSGICGGIRRSFVHDGLYPMPSPNFSGSSNGEPVACQQQEPKECESEYRLSTIKACAMMDYVLMPLSRRGLNQSSTKCLYAAKTIDSLREQVKESGAIECASAIVSSYDGKPTTQSGHSDDGKGLGELIFTGTGSAIPCKHRNVTGMYLRMNNGNSILLDVGEGTVGQLLRSWKSTLSSDQNPLDEYCSRLRGIKAVWISHPHADHHLGLLRLLSERAAICDSKNDPIVLMAPPDMFDFLHEYQSILLDIAQSYIPVDCYDMIHGKVNPLGDRLYDMLGITYCASIPVAHCLRSYAVVIDGTSFGRVAYSGDCRPSNRFADVAYGADLLIHEATFEIGMEEDAVLKRHSTVGEAIEISQKMNAKSLVLTHFSQRYPEIPPLNEENSGDDGEGKADKDVPIVFAFDFLRLTPGKIDLAAKLTSALRLLYPCEGAVDEAELASGKVSAKELMSVPGVFAAKGVL